ncbi:MAG: hypothetical protein ACKOOL_04165 [Novosphingobium sp.]
MRWLAVLVVTALAALWSPAARAETWAKCTEPNYLSSFDERLGPQACDVVATARVRWSGGSTTIRVIRPRALPAGDNASMQRRVSETAGLVGPAMDAMGGGMILPETTILMTDYVSPREIQEGRVIRKGNWKAEALGIYGNECPVNWYKSHYAGTGTDFVFILSHELFHCVQFASFHLPEDEYWMWEGSAEYFAHLAEHNGPLQFVDQFASSITTTPLNRMDYPAFVFFTWLGGANGPPKVKQLLASARSVDSITPDMFMQFAKAWYETSIRLPDGRGLGVTPDSGPTVQLRGTQRLTSPALTPYTFSTQIVSFERGKRYDVTEQPGPEDSRTMWRSGGSGIFGETPRTVRTCSGPVRYQVIRTATRSNRGAIYQVDARAATQDECACPAGVWQETPQSTRRFFEQSAIGGGGAHYISGTRVLSLNADHTGSLSYNSVEVEFRSNPEYWIHQVVTGGTQFTWKTINGKLLTVYVHGSKPLVTLNNEIHARSGVNHETRMAGAQSIGHDFYCDEAGLHLKGPQGYKPSYLPASMPFNFSVDLDFVRIGGS